MGHLTPSQQGMSRTLVQKLWSLGDRAVDAIRRVLRTFRQGDTHTRVWYCAYGSNVDRERFTCYLEGRSPAPGVRQPARCLAGTKIYGDKALLLPHLIYFARRAANWDGGGVAFVQLAGTEPAPTYGRAYLLTLDQFRHVAKEENGGSVEITIPPTALRGQPVQIAERGWYAVLLPCGELRGVPVVTLTGRQDTMALRNAPAASYLAKIRSGLRQAYPGLSDADIDLYLSAAVAGP